MGRGRAKAKQVKVARQLKYNSGGTDLDRLRAELGVGSDQRDDERESAMTMISPTVTQAKKTRTTASQAAGTVRAEPVRRRYRPG